MKIRPTKQLYPFLIFSLLSITNCKYANNSAPKAMLRSYLLNEISRNFKFCYNLLSTKSKEHITFDEFQKVLKDTPLKIIQFDSIQELKDDSDYPTFKRFKSVNKYITSTNDTVRHINYYTLVKQNGKWKRAWCYTLYLLAAQDSSKGDYKDAINSLNKALEVNPLDGECYGTLAKFYLQKKEFKSAIDFSKKALKLSLSKKDSSDNSCKIGWIFLDAYFTNDINDFTFPLDSAAVYLENSYNLNPYNCKTLLGLSNIELNRADFSDCISFLNRINPDELGIDESKYYYYYAVALKDINERGKSKEYILKALKIEPSNETYKSFYNTINFPGW
jgi:tetratricopeptide (TPR) repeat protein